MKNYIFVFVLSFVIIQIIGINTYETIEEGIITGLLAGFLAIAIRMALDVFTRKNEV